MVRSNLFDTVMFVPLSEVMRTSMVSVPSTVKIVLEQA